MSIHIKVDGTWRQVSADADSQCGYIKVDGTWRTVSNSYVKVDGTWRTVCAPSPTPTPTPAPTPTPSPGGGGSCTNPNACVGGVAAGFADYSYSPPTEACTTSTGAAGTRTVAWTCNTSANCPDIPHAAGTCVANQSSTPCCQQDDGEPRCVNGVLYKDYYDPCALTSCTPVAIGTCASGAGVNCSTVTSSTSGVFGSWPSCASGLGYYTVNYYDSSCTVTNAKVFESCYTAPAPAKDCTTCVYGTFNQACGTYNNGTQSHCVTANGCQDILGPCIGDYNPTPTVNCSSCPYGSGYQACGTYGNGSQYYCITPVGCSNIYGSCTGDYAPAPAPRPTPTPTPSPCVANAGAGCGRYGNGTVTCSGSCSGDRCC